jgi:hypothetical protein
MRFEAVKVSSGWSVHDVIFDLPAEAGGRLLTGLSRDEAEKAAAAANQEMLRWRPAPKGPDNRALSG